jgi:hypothetical protein
MNGETVVILDCAGYSLESQRVIFDGGINGGNYFDRRGRYRHQQSDL